MTGLISQVRSWSAAQCGLRVVVLLGPVLALLAAGPAGDAPPSWLLAVLVLVAAAFALAPDSDAGTAAFVIVAGWWCTVAHDGLSPLVLLAAAAVLAAHVAALLASYGPGQTRVDQALVVMWVRRGGLALIAAPGVWLLSVAVRGTVTPGGIWTAGMSAAIAALLVGSAAVATRSSDR